MDSFKVYWYEDNNGTLKLMLNAPNKDHIKQKISSIGVPGLAAVSFEYNDYKVNKLLPDTEIGNIDMIKDIMQEAKSYGM